MNNTKNILLVTVYKILSKSRKHYISPSAPALLGIMDTIHGRRIGERWLYQCLSDLDAAGLIGRHERFEKQPDGSWLQLPGLITLTLAGAKYLYRRGVTGALQIIKNIMAWLQKRDGRWPTLDKLTGLLNIKSIPDVTAAPLSG